MYYAVIMAGGSGTRLWPFSRQGRPKQALTLVGNRTMFQHAVDRIRPIFPVERILVVTRAEYASVLGSQAPDLPPENLILEPEGRGTAPAIGLAAIHLQQRDPDAVMAILTADHFIAETELFCRVLSTAAQISADGTLVTLGIPPSSASSGFGYIQHGSELGEKNGLRYYAVERFVEKPNPVAAQTMVASGTVSWNSGMFICQVQRMMMEFECQIPGLYARLMEIKAAIGQPGYRAKLERNWPLIAKQTIDYGVMESATRVAVIPVEIGWTDIGSWGSLFQLLPADANGNVMVGHHLDIDTKGTLIFGGNRLIATLGVSDLIIVETDDAVLVCSRAQEQAVRAIVEQLTKTEDASLT